MELGSTASGAGILPMRSENIDAYLARQAAEGIPIGSDDDDDVVEYSPTTAHVHKAATIYVKDEPVEYAIADVEDGYRPDSPHRPPNPPGAGPAGSPADVEMVLDEPPPQTREARHSTMTNNDARASQDERLAAGDQSPLLAHGDIYVKGCNGRALVDGLLENEHIQGIAPSQRIFYKSYDDNVLVVKIVEMEDLTGSAIDQRRWPKKLERNVDRAVLGALPNEEVKVVAAYAPPGDPNAAALRNTGFIYNLSDELFGLFSSERDWVFGTLYCMMLPLETRRSPFLSTFDGMQLGYSDLPKVDAALLEMWSKDTYVADIFNHYLQHGLGVVVNPRETFLGSIATDLLDVTIAGVPTRQIQVSANSGDLPHDLLARMRDHLRSLPIQVPSLGEARAFARPWKCKRCGATSHPEGKCPNLLLKPAVDAPTPAAALMPPPPPPPPAPPAAPAPAPAPGPPRNFKGKGERRQNNLAAPQPRKGGNGFRNDNGGRRGPDNFDRDDTPRASGSGSSRR